MSDALATIYSRSDAFKRKLIDALRNPRLAAEQIVGDANDRARVLNEMTSAAAQESIDYGPASQRLAAALANSYAPVGMITPATAEALRGMTREQFLGNPKLVGMSDAKDLRPRVWPGVQEAQPQPFLGGKYELRMTPDAAAVFDKGAPVASYNGNSTLVVDPKYRRQGIGEELVYQQRTSFPAPAEAKSRNKVSQRIQESVWERIQRELNAE